MYLSKLSVRNFRNFQSVDVALAGNVVLLGENRVGKSNLLFAIQLILDPTLPDSARQLKLTDFWDGGPTDYSAPIEVHLEISDFATDMALTALLTDFRAPHDPTIARLSYVFRKKSDVTGAPQSGAGCEFLVFGGGDETRSLPSKLRRRIAIDLLDALRDAEGQLGSWLASPLRHLLEEAVSGISRPDLDTVATELDKASKTLEAFPTIKTLEDELRAGIAHLSGKAHDIDARLRFAPAEPPYARLLSQAITLVYGRHASEREEQNLSAQLMGFLNASLGTTETTHFWLQRFSRELVTLWRMIARNSEQEWDVCAEMITNTDPARDLDLSLAHFFTCSASQRAQAFICTE